MWLWIAALLVVRLLRLKAGAGARRRLAPERVEAQAPDHAVDAVAQGVPLGWREGCGQHGVGALAGGRRRGRGRRDRRPACGAAADGQQRLAALLDALQRREVVEAVLGAGLVGGGVRLIGGVVGQRVALCGGQRGEGVVVGGVGGMVLLRHLGRRPRVLGLLGRP